MTPILQGCRNTLCYIDDSAAFGCTREEPDATSNAGLQLNDKRIFGVKELDVLGHRMSEEGVRPLLGNAEAIQTVPAPTNVALAWLDYYAKFMPH